ARADDIDKVDEADLDARADPRHPARDDHDDIARRRVHGDRAGSAPELGITARRDPDDRRRRVPRARRLRLHAGAPAPTSVSSSSVASLRLPRIVHPIAWWIWAIGLATAATR